MSDEVPPGGRVVTEADIPWAAWTPWQLADRLQAVDVPWGVAGGWAVDLFLGCSGLHDATREHEDLEIALPAAAFGSVRAALPELRFEVVGDGRTWPEGHRRAMELNHQTWGWDDAVAAYVVDVFREPHDGGTWICRRDVSLRRPYAEVLARTAAGVPYVVPEIVLLFKAKAARPKDEADLAAVLPRLSDGRRAWLVEALDRAHPGHAWADRVRGPGAGLSGPAR